MLKVIQEKIGKILIAEGHLTEEQLGRALDEQKKHPLKHRQIGSFLTQLGYVSEEIVLKALGIQFNLPTMKLKDIVVDSHVLQMIPEAMARRFKILPLYLVEKELTTAVSDPTKIEIMDILSNQTRCRIQPVLALESEIETAIEANYRASSSVQTVPTLDEGPMSAAERKHLEQAGTEVSIVRIVDDLLLQAYQEGASDIHIEPREGHLSVRFRVDGVLKDCHTFSLKQQPAVLSRLKIISQMDISERQKPQDGRIKIKIAGREVDVRVSTLPIFHGEKMVLRLLDQQKVHLSLEELAMSPQNLVKMRNMMIQPYGLILVTGPTGSGKSTTLYAVINAINSEEKNIVTVEDPIEYQIDRINQSQVNNKKDMNFSNILRSILRQDPDVVLIGEIRDHETGEIATEAALTGHLVLSTLHTNDAPSAVARLIEMAIEPFLLAPSLLGIVAQRLARKICSECKETYTPARAEVEHLGIPNLPSGVSFARGKGCQACKESGYKGRIAIHEILIADETIRRLITERAPSPLIRSHALNNGFIDMRLDGIRKVARGLTSVEEVLRVTRGL